MTAQTAVATQQSKTPSLVKKTETENVFEGIEQVYDSIARRAFEIFDNNGRWFGRELDDWLKAESELFHPVHLEIAESNENLTVRAEVPGFSAKEVEINVEPRRLMITGKHEAKEESKKGKTIYSERCAKEIMRVVHLPAEVDSSKVNATLKDGVLNIELPKVAPAKTVRVEPKER
ncbi:MAG: Hsp20 family protein [Candidatus Acidiferrales bacterium]|jgi:HSP20 family protein